jgi:hypothetical protein
MVRRAIKAEPSADSLFEFLKFADQDLIFSAIKTKAARERLSKQLKVEMHPDTSHGKGDTASKASPCFIYAA